MVFLFERRIKTPLKKIRYTKKDEPQNLWLCLTELRGAEKCRNVMIAEEYISVRRVIARSAALTNGRENSAFAVAILFKTH